MGQKVSCFTFVHHPTPVLFSKLAPSLLPVVLEVFKSYSDTELTTIISYQFNRNMDSHNQLWIRPAKRWKCT